MAAPTSAAQQLPHQGLPSITSLTNGLPPSSAQLSPEAISATDSTRDSGTWPQPQSKHTSANSGLQVRTLLNPDDSPSRSSIPTTPLSARQSGPPTIGSQLPSINQGFQDGSHRDSRDQYRDSYHPSIDSRRSSVDSRMHQGFNNLYINNPTSPYESTNGSQVSLAANLRRPNGAQAPLSPLNGRSSLRSNPPGPRVAPPILPVGRAPGQPDPTAAKPTQGFAWAFPDEAIPEERRGSDSGDSSETGPGMSRTNSFAASSIRSSIFSNDSHMPHGQRRFDDEQATTHHHTMQHRTIQSLQSDKMTPQAVGNYSRTPELRVSHKLAERKRRSEMKDLFEELNKAVPSNGGSKASKWEILTKAIDYIRAAQHQEQHLKHELTMLKRESDCTRDAFKENEMLKTEVQVMHQHLARLDPNATHVYGHFTSQLSQGHPQQQPPPPPPPSQPQPPQTNGAPSGVSLPPLNPASAAGLPPPGHFGTVGPGGPAPPIAMQGVEYGYGQR